MPLCPTCNARYDAGTFCPKDGTALLPDGQETQTLVGQVIGGRYRLTKLLGQGGMGEVYAAQHVRITKRVAVKVLHPDISQNPEALQRFQQEAQSASSIGHDNIVTIDDFDTLEDGRFYLCMEFLEGESLAEAMQAQGGLEWGRLLEIMIQVCDGLAAAHAKGIIHRDMKPENVFLTRRSDSREVAKILDFGIAKVSGTDENQNLTKTGTVFGTPHYMSPEQALGQKVDARADVYSMGVMLFEMVTGQVPFKAESFMGILSQHITKQPPQPSTVTPGRVIPRPLEDIILKAMAKEPSGRYSTMAEMRTALEAVRAEADAANAGAAAGIAPTMASMPAATPAAGMAAAGAALPGTRAGVPVHPTPAAGGDIPRTVMAGQGGAPAYATPQGQIPVVPSPTPVPVVPSPVPVVSAPTQVAPKKGNTGLIVGIIVAVLVLGGGGAAAAIFWDDIMGNKGPAVAGGGDPTQPVAPAPDTGVAASPQPDAGPQVAAAAPDAAAVADPGGEPATPGEQPGKRPGKQPVKVAVADPVQPAEPVKPTHPVEIAKPVETKKPAEPTKPAEPVKPAKAFVEVQLVTVPGGASVLSLSPRRRIGHTPMTFKMKPGQTRSVLVAKSGYKDQSVTVRAGDDDGTQTVRLRRGVTAGSIGIPGGDPF